MNKIIQFLKATKVISRILVVLWIFFSLAGAGFNVSDFVYTFPTLAIVFLVPAICIEFKKNPVLKETVNKIKENSSIDNNSKINTKL